MQYSPAHIASGEFRNLTDTFTFELIPSNQAINQIGWRWREKVLCDKCFNDGIHALPRSAVHKLIINP